MRLPTGEESDEIQVAFNRWHEATRAYNARVYECLAGRPGPCAETIESVQRMYAAFEDYHRRIEPFMGCGH